MKNIHLGALDSFRGVAAISVVVYHLYISSAVSEWDFFRHSSLFVPFFFVLSGFVIAYVYDKATFSFKRFMIARGFRILPLYYLMLVCFIALECLNYVLYHHFGLFFKNIPFSGDRGFDQILPNLFLLQSWLPWTYPLSFNNPAWSLSVEWYLYIFFGILMFIPKFARYAIMLLGASFAYFHLMGFIRGEGVSGILYFCSGALVYWVFTLYKTKPLSPLLLTILEALIIIASIYIITSGKEQYAVFVFSGLVLIFGLSSYWKNTAYKGGGITYILETRVFIFLGALSYSIYISHYFIISIIKATMSLLAKYGYWEMIRINEQLYINFHNAVLANLYLLANLCVVVAFAYLLHTYIEKPCIAFGKNLINKRT